MELPVLAGREVVRLLEKDGFVVVATRGSHVRLKRQAPPPRTVIVPLHESLATGTLQSILRQAGWTRVQLLDRLR